MPSTKPQILIRTEQDLIDKLDEIAKSQNRSRGNLAETILKEYVNKYEVNQARNEFKNIKDKCIMTSRKDTLKELMEQVRINQEQQKKLSN